MNTLKKTINGIDFYSDGRIEKNGKSCTRENHDGYLDVDYCKKTWRSHRLIYTIFIGEIPSGLEIDHIDGNRKNNSIHNLEPITHGENIRRAAARGSYKNNALRSGSNHGRSILDDMQVLTIRTMPKRAKNGRGSGVSNAELAKLYGVSVTRIANIRNGKEWKMLPDAS